MKGMNLEPQISALVDLVSLCVESHSAKGFKVTQTCLYSPADVVMDGNNGMKETIAYCAAGWQEVCVGGYCGGGAPTGKGQSAFGQLSSV